MFLMINSVSYSDLLNVYSTSMNLFSVYSFNMIYIKWFICLFANRFLLARHKAALDVYTQTETISQNDWVTSSFWNNLPYEIRMAPCFRNAACCEILCCRCGDLSSCVRVSDYIESIYDVACSVHLHPMAVYNLLFSVSCQSALSVVCLRIILNLDHSLYTLGWFKLIMHTKAFSVYRILHMLYKTLPPWLRLSTICDIYIWNNANIIIIIFYCKAKQKINKRKE